jgi:hypothetical protein
LAWPLPSLGPVIRRRTSAHSALDAVLLRFRNAHVRRRRLNWSRNTPAVWRSISACAPALNLREKLCQIRDARCGSAGCGGHSGACMMLRMMRSASLWVEHSVFVATANGPIFTVVCAPDGGSSSDHEVDELWHAKAGTNTSNGMRLCFDPESAAKTLGFCDREVLRSMRVERWYSSAG